MDWIHLDHCRAQQQDLVTMVINGQNGVESHDEMGD